MSSSVFPSRAVSVRPDALGGSQRARGELLLYVAYVGVLAIAFRWLEGPPIFQDNAFFLLVSYAWINGLGFDNIWVNPIDSNIFNWHGFLQPMLVGWLSPCRTLECVNVALIVVATAYLAIWYLVVNAAIANRALRLVLYVIGAAYVLQYSARPELLASLLLVALTALFYFKGGERSFAWRAIAAGILVGLAIVTSPIAGALAGLGVAGATLFVRRNDKSYAGFLAEGALCLATMLLTVGAMLAFVYPHSPQEWFEGIRLHSLKTAAREDTGAFLKAYVATKLVPFQVVMLPVLAGIVVYALKEIWRAGSKPFALLFMLICIAAAALLYVTAIRIPVTVYNFMVLVPAIALTAAMLASQLGVNNRYPSLALTAPLALVAVAALLGQIFWAAQTLTFVRGQQELESGINQSLDRYIADNRRIAMDSPLMAAVDDIQKLKDVTVVFWGQEISDLPRVDVLFRAQKEFPILERDIPGFTLVKNGYDQSSIARLLAPKGTFYAIYEAVRR